MILQHCPLYPVLLRVGDMSLSSSSDWEKSRHTFQKLWPKDHNIKGWLEFSDDDS
ncbi:unnamed protein product, partial [Ceratitis capitata]